MKLAVVFPGTGYHEDKPLLYYSRKLAAEAGYQVKGVKYGKLPDMAGGNDKEGMKAAFSHALGQAEALLRDMDFGECQEILFLSKSIGTAVAAAFAKRHGLRTRNVYYTPVGESFALIEQPGIVFHGTKDPWVETKTVEEGCRKLGLPLYITENGNHSLETGDALKDLENLCRIMKISGEYIKKDVTVQPC